MLFKKKQENSHTLISGTGVSGTGVAFAFVIVVVVVVNCLYADPHIDVVEFLFGR